LATVETDTVTLTINGREITAPKGMSLVEAAAEAGIEVPVFCYEPRLGAAVGACRMCLVEIEGMPKLQTACTTPAGEGMVVHSASERAAEGQNAVLEFLLINHPLDCPVCDKGGECPLQDLTFRYGPGSTRMTLPKRTAAKPIPISPLIKLDRERCILCYRCTRFSENVSGDLQLVPEHRGANSIITTFEGRPYDGEFSGNVTELCPVGALTSTSYRFRGRPWEIQNVPTVCGHCPVGCNISASIREGHVTRVLSRNHAEVDDGWLCDKGRYVYTAYEAEDRIRSPLIRGGRGLEQATEQTVMDHVADRLRATIEKFGPGSVAILASGEQTNEEAHLWSRIQREALGGGPIVCGPESGAGWERVAPYAARIADLDEADVILVAGDTELAHRVPVMELRVRRAATNGARVVCVGAGGTRLETLRHAEHISAAPGTAHAALLEALDGELGETLRSGRAILIWAGRMSEPVAAVLAHVAHSTGASVLPTPAATNELGCTAAGLAGATAEQVLADIDEGKIKAIVLLGADPVGAWAAGERWRAAMGRSFFALQIAAFQDGSSGWATTIVPASAPTEKEGTATNLEGRVQRLRAAVPPPAGVPDGLAWATALAERLGLSVPASAAGVFAELAAGRPAFAGMAWSTVGEHSEEETASRRPAQAPPVPQLAEAAPPEGMVVVGYRQLHSGPASDHAPLLHFQRRSGIEISHEDAQSLGVASGDLITIGFDGRRATAGAVVNRRLRPGVVRLPADPPFVGPASITADEEQADA